MINSHQPGQRSHWSTGQWRGQWRQFSVGQTGRTRVWAGRESACRRNRGNYLMVAVDDQTWIRSLKALKKKKKLYYKFIVEFTTAPSLLGRMFLNNSEKPWACLYCLPACLHWNGPALKTTIRIVPLRFILPFLIQRFTRENTSSWKPTDGNLGTGSKGKSWTCTDSHLST